MANGGMTQVNEMCRRHGGKALVVDWKSFDKTIPSWLIRDAFALLADLVDFLKFWTQMVLYGRPFLINHDAVARRRLIIL